MTNSKLWALTMFVIASAILILMCLPAAWPFIISALIAYILYPLVKLIETKFRIKRIFAIIIVFVVVILVISGIFLIILPPIINQVITASKNFNSYLKLFDIEQIKGYFEERNYPDFIQDNIESLIQRAGGYAQSFLEALANYLMNMVSKIFDLILIIVLTCYFIADGQKLIEAAQKAVPHKYRRRAEKIINDFHLLFRRYIKTQVLISLLLSVIMWLFLFILGIKSAPLLAFLTFILNFIPYFGSITAGIVTTIVAYFTGGIPLAAAALIGCVIIQQLEGNVLTPRIQGHSSGLHPVIVIFAVMAANRLMGPIGMFLAVPLAGFIRIIFKNWSEIIKEMT